MAYNPVKISEKALHEVKEIVAKKGIADNYGLRIGIKGAGCAGISYLIGFDIKKEDDLEIDEAGVTVFIQKKHVMYLVGVHLDFHEGADARGFTFLNGVD